MAFEDLDERHRLTIGFIAVELQRPVAAVERAVELLGLSPVLVVNSGRHFSARQAAQIAAFVEARPSAQGNSLAEDLLGGGNASPLGGGAVH